MKGYDIYHMVVSKSIIVVILTALFFVSSAPVSALVINEIYPAPETNNDEWVELYNDTDLPIDLSEFVITDETGKQASFENQTINAKDFALALSKNVFNNTGDTVVLKKLNGETIEIATYSGSIDSSKSIGRCPDGIGNFITMHLISKKASNTNLCTTTTQKPQQNNSQDPIVSPNQTYKYIYISEAMVQPKPDEKEWIELYNDNPTEVHMNDWFIDDIENGGSSPKPFTLAIAANSYGVITLSSDMFNNSGDTVRLLDANQIQIDTISYSSATQAKSIGKIDMRQQHVCLQDPTQGARNSSCLVEVQKSSITIKPTPTIQKTTTSYIEINDTDSQQALSLIKTNIKPSSKPKAFTFPEENGQILAVQDEKKDNLAYTAAKSFSVSSYLISLFTISYLIHRIVKKSKKLYRN